MCECLRARFLALVCQCASACYWGCAGGDPVKMKRRRKEEEEEGGAEEKGRADPASLELDCDLTSFAAVLMVGSLLRFPTLSRLITSFLALSCVYIYFFFFNKSFYFLGSSGALGEGKGGSEGR